MGMSTNVVGFKPPDEKWQKMKAIYDACALGGVPIPVEVNRYFDFIPPSATGVLVDLEKSACCRKFEGDCNKGFEIDITKLPDDVTIIRFWNGY